MKENDNKKPKTLEDLAAIANVSPSTVSRAMNDSPLISEKTKKRIQDLAAQYDIRIHQGARNLRLQETKIIGLITHEKDKLDFGEADPFDLQMIGAISSKLKKNGYDLLFIQAASDDNDWPQRYYQQSRVDGFILMCFAQKKEIIDKLLKIKAPFVVFGTPFYKNRYGGVISDNTGGARLAVKHLLEQNRTHIAFIGGPAQNQEVKERLEGYKAAFREMDTKWDENLIRFGDYSSRSSEEITKDFIKSGALIDGIFAASDVMAMSAMSILEQNNIAIPQDVAVIGFDDIPLSAYSKPSLTTVKQNIGQVGSLLVEYLINYIQNGQISHTIVPVNLVTRESTKI